MLQSFLFKQLLKSKLKDVPEAEREKMLALVEKHPDFIGKIAAEVQQKVQSGQDQMQATMDVLKAHEEELRGIAGE